MEQVPKLNTKKDSKNLYWNGKTFWIDTLDKLEPQGLNMKISKKNT